MVHLILVRVTWQSASKGYDNVHVEIDVDGSYLSMDRKLNETVVHVVSNVEGIASGDYTLKGKYGGHV